MLSFDSRSKEHLLAGHIPEAMAKIEQAAPGTLESHPRVKLQLQCQQSVEMVCSPCCLRVLNMLIAHYKLSKQRLYVYGFQSL